MYDSSVKGVKHFTSYSGYLSRTDLHPDIDIEDCLSLIEIIAGP
jgi:hypothetical protein